MKTLLFKNIPLTILLLAISLVGFTQSKPSIAILSLDTKNVTSDNAGMGNMIRLQLEKTGKYEVLDKYDVQDLAKEQGIDPNNTFGKKKLVKLGQQLKADKMLTGSCEKFSETIIISLRLIDVHSDKIEKAVVLEFINQQTELKAMLQISINDLLDIENDPNLVNLLINYNRVITSEKTKVKLNGPRMGATMMTGNINKRLTAAKAQGGYNMYPVSSSFGYQYEMQYLSAGDFQALVEVFGAVNGLESGQFIPSVAFINGFRFNKGGYEFGLGPVLRFTKTAMGVYDSEGTWIHHSELPSDHNHTLIEEIDNRGKLKLSTSLIIGVGKTFKSGYLNIPVNLYFSPRKEGNLIGISFGFNIAKKTR